MLAVELTLINLQIEFIITSTRNLIQKKKKKTDWILPDLQGGVAI